MGNVTMLSDPLHPFVTFYPLSDVIFDRLLRTMASETKIILGNCQKLPNLQNLMKSLTLLNNLINKRKCHSNIIFLPGKLRC